MKIHRIEDDFGDVQEFVFLSEAIQTVESCDINRTRDDCWIAIGDLSWDGNEIRPDWLQDKRRVIPIKKIIKEIKSLAQKADRMVYLREVRKIFHSYM